MIELAFIFGLVIGTFCGIFIIGVCGMVMENRNYKDDMKLGEIYNDKF